MMIYKFSKKSVTSLIYLFLPIFIMGSQLACENKATDTASANRGPNSKSQNSDSQVTQENGSLGEDPTADIDETALEAEEKESDPAPVIAPPKIPLHRLYAGEDQTCSLSPAGEVKCWGYERDSKLGYGNSVTYKTVQIEGFVDTSPVLDLPPARAVPLPLKAIDLSIGLRHACAILEDGSVSCWGQSVSGTLGTGRGETDQTPVQAPGKRSLLPAGKKAKSIYSNWFASCALLDDASIACWGYNTGMLGQTSLGYANPTPLSVILPAGLKAGSIAVPTTSTNVACATFDNGSARCWGAANANGGQLGYPNNSNVFSTLPDNNVGANIRGITPPAAEAINFGAGRTVVAISPGNGFTCALLDDKSIRCFGSNSVGQLGTAETATFRVTPGAAVTFAADRFPTSVHTGVNGACAIMDEGSLYCWGENLGNRFGLGAQTSTPTPVKINLGNTKKVKSVSMNRHICAVLEDNTALCWGQNRYAQLGTGNMLDLAPNAAKPLPLSSP